MDVQELANSMYSLALLSFDFPHGPLPTPSQEEIAMDAQQAATLALTKPPSLWSLHEMYMRRFRELRTSEWALENYDQFAMYFELIRTCEFSFPFSKKYVMGSSNFPLASLDSLLLTSLLPSLYFPSLSSRFLVCPLPKSLAASSSFAATSATGRLAPAPVVGSPAACTRDAPTP